MALLASYRPGAVRATLRGPKLANESFDAKRCTLAPMARGSCILRDARIWHGGTPNRKSEPRYLPNLEFYSREYANYVNRQGGAHRFNKPTMTIEVFQLLSPRAQQVAEGLVAKQEVPRGIKPNFAKPQGKVFVKMIVEKLNASGAGETVVFTGNSFEAHLIREICTEHRWQTQTQRDGQKCTISATRSDRFLTRKRKNKSKH